MKLLVTWLTLAGATGLGASGTAAAAAEQTTCADLAGGVFGGGVVLETEKVSGTTEVRSAYGGSTVLDRPTCRVRGRIQPSSDSDVRFEVWLPEKAAWNGRYQGVGGGGNAGNMPLASMKNALDGGYAVSGQDNGHVGSSDDSSYAVGHPEKVIDFGWRSLHAVAVASKAIVAAYYGRPAELALFNGCSTGGRQGLALAQRFPDDYDGIAAGAPANYWPELNALHAEFGRFLVENPDSWVSPEKMTIVQDAVHEACGAIDGIIDDSAACTFDVSTLGCSGTPADRCLTAAEIAGVEKRFADLVGDDGRLIYPGFTHGLDARIGPSWMGSDAKNPFFSSRTGRYPDRFFADYVHEREDWSVREFDRKTDLRAARAGVIGISVAAEDPDLSDFARRGGKLLQWHGWQDMGIPARNSVRYYEQVEAEMGAAAVDGFYRLFMGTGVDHCGGGIGPDSIGGTFGKPAPQRDADHDVMEALVRWISTDRAPEKIIATRYAEDGSVVAQRPWCAYPSVARWDGKGDRSKPESYRCSDSASACASARPAAMKRQARAPDTRPFGPEAFEASGVTTLRWLGMAGLLINSRGTTLMVDPLLQGFDMPLLIQMPISPRDVPRLDAILVTHGDNDHYSVPTCRALAPVTRAFHSTRYVASRMESEGLPSFGHDIGAAFSVGPVQVRLTPADHAWQNETPGAATRRFEKEDSAGFWIDTPDGTIWATGDSRLMPEHLEMPTPDAILFDWSDSEWHFGLVGAIELANAHPEAALLLSHWGSVDAPDFAPFNADPRQLEGRVVNPARIHLLAPGQPFLLQRVKAPPLRTR